VGNIVTVNVRYIVFHSKFACRTVQLSNIKLRTVNMWNCKLFY